MKTMIRSINRNWNAHSPEMKEFLGLGAKQKLPDAGMPEQVIQGIRVYVKPRTPNIGRHKTHRVTAICPHCAQHMSAGRMHQHKCKHA